MKHKTVLVTGGAGFIGSHLVERLVTTGRDVTVIDNFSRGTEKNLARVIKKIRVIMADLRNPAVSENFFANHDVVYNLAALNTGVDFDIGRTEYMFEENILLQMIPLRAAAKTHVKTFIQMSTASIYSTDAMEKRIPTNEADDRGEPEPSKSGYAWAKRMGERLSAWYGENSPMKTVVARSINVYGARDHFDERGHFLPCMIKKFLTADRSVEVFGSGKQRRSFIHVADLVEALLLLGEKGVNGQAYNIDPQDEHSVEEIVEKIGTHIHPRKKIVFNTSLPEGSKRRMLDARKIRELGWKPTHTLLDTIPALIVDIEKRLKP